MPDAGKAEAPAPRPASAGEARLDRGQWLPIAGLVVGVWATLPHFVSPAINTAERVEIADHVVPGVVVIAVSIVALVLSRSGPPAPMFMFAAGLIVCLAGLWMVSTHVPLVGQAIRGDRGVTWAATLWHCLAATVVSVLGVTWVVAYWSAVDR
jgi:hypothetical protein